MSRKHGCVSSDHFQEPRSNPGLLLFPGVLLKAAPQKIKSLL